MLNRFDIKLLKAPTPPVQETCCSTVFSCARTCMKFIEDGFWWVLRGILLHVQLNSLSIYCLSSIVIYFLGDNLERPDKENTTEMWNGKRKSPVPMQTKNPQPWEWGPILEITLCSIISTHSSCFGFLSAYCAVNSTVPSLKTWIQTWKLLTFD